MAATKKTPATTSDALKAKRDALLADRDRLGLSQAASRERLGDELFAGDTDAAKATEAEIAANDVALDRFDLQIGGAARKIESVEKAEQKAARRAAIVAYNADLRAADKATRILVAGVLALRVPADEARARVSDARQSVRQIEGRAGGPEWQSGLLREVVFGSIGSAFGEKRMGLYADAAAAKLDAYYDRLLIDEDE